MPEIKGKWPIFQFFSTFFLFQSIYRLPNDQKWWNRYRFWSFHQSGSLWITFHQVLTKNGQFLSANSFWIWPKNAICFYFFWTIKLKIIFWEENTYNIFWSQPSFHDFLDANGSKNAPSSLKKKFHFQYLSLG